MTTVSTPATVSAADRRHTLIDEFGMLNTIPVLNPDDIHRVECPMTSAAICATSLAHPGDPTVLDTDKLTHRLVVETGGRVTDTVSCVWDYPDDDTDIVIAEIEAHVLTGNTRAALTREDNYDADSRDLTIHVTDHLDPELAETWLIVDAVTITEHWRGEGLLTVLLTRLADLAHATRIVLVAAPLATGLPQHPDNFIAIQNHYASLGFSFVDDVPEFYPADPEQLARVMTAQVDTLR